MPKIPHLLHNLRVLALIHDSSMVEPCIRNELGLCLDSFVSFSACFPDHSHLVVVVAVTPLVKIDE
jgi:hypothetical protein